MTQDEIFLFQNYPEDFRKMTIIYFTVVLLLLLGRLGCGLADVGYLLTKVLLLLLLQAARL